MRGLRRDRALSSNAFEVRDLSGDVSAIATKKSDGGFVGPRVIQPQRVTEHEGTSLESRPAFALVDTHRLED